MAHHVVNYVNPDEQLLRALLHVYFTGCVLRVIHGQIEATLHEDGLILVASRPPTVFDRAFILLPGDGPCSQNPLLLGLGIARVSWDRLVQGQKERITLSNRK
jgi:hypothetical protein